MNTRSIVILPVLLILIVAFLSVAPALQANVANHTPADFDGIALTAGGVIDVYNSHAWDDHGEEGISALRCLENKGPSLTWRERGKGPVHFLCLGDDGKWYDVIVDYLKKGKMELKSAFSPKSGASNQADALRIWLQDKGATVWKGGPSSVEFRWNIPRPW